MAQKNEQGDKRQIKLIDFNVNILEAILKFLPPDDLASLSQTCMKFQQEVERFFDLKRDCGLVRIGNQGNLYNFVNHGYEEHFLSLIKHVKVEVNNRSRTSTRDAFDMIKKNCCMQLRSLQLHNRFGLFGSPPVRLDGCEIIADQLRNIEILELVGISAADIMNYCPNLQTFIAKTERANADFSWLDQVWPKLEVLFFHANEGNSVDMSGFLLNHRQLTNVICIGKSAVGSLLLTEVDLPHVTIGWSHNQRVLWNDFIQYFSRNRVKSLDLNLPDTINNEELKQILSLEAVKSVHISCKLEITGTYPNIERCCLYVEDYIMLFHGNCLLRILKCFPNLRVLRLSTESGLLQPEYVFWIIAKNFPLLQYISLDFDIGANLKKLSSERAKLPGAKTVKMRFSEISLSPSQWKEEFVVIEPREDLNCPICVPEADDLHREIVTYLSTSNS